MNQIIVLLQLCLALLSNPATAQNPDTQALVSQAISAATQALAATTTPAIAPIITPDATSTPPTVNPPLGAAQAPQTQNNTMEKTITITQDGMRIFAVYQENGKNVEGIPLTLTADDNGKISHSSVADKWATANNVELTHDVTVFNRPDFTIGAVFEYQPEATGTRTLTVEGNGASQTLRVAGK